MSVGFYERNRDNSPGKTKMELKAGRPRDFEDALSVMERCRDELDLEYIQDWAARLGVTTELGYILQL